MSLRPSPPPRVSAAAAPEPPAKERLVNRLIIAPLTFLSFLISLALVDAHDQTLRNHLHPSRPAAPTTILGRIEATFHGLIYKPTPAGGQYSYVQTRGKGGSGNGEVWYWRIKQRQLIKAEFTDALLIRKRVLVMMAAVAIAVFLSIAAIALWAMNFWRKRDFWI